MGITLNELNYLVTRADLVELERKINLHYASIIEELKKTRSFTEVSKEVTEKRKEFISIPEFARITGRSWQTIKNWIMAGVINGAQPEGKGNGWIIPFSELEKVKEMCNL